MPIPHGRSYLHGSYTVTNAKPNESAANHRIPSTSNDLHHLRRFIGMVKYLSKFDHSLRTKCEPLNMEGPGFPMGRGVTKSI